MNKPLQLYRGSGQLDFLGNLSFNILQVARMQSCKPISSLAQAVAEPTLIFKMCRSAFESALRISPGVKIAIMRCFVNGTDEMADVDFGYVESKPGMIDLYFRKTMHRKRH